MYKRQLHVLRSVGMERVQVEKSAMMETVKRMMDAVMNVRLKMDGNVWEVPQLAKEYVGMASF